MKPTKLKILESGARLIRKHGYHSCGLQQILNDAGVPKGSFYFYFKNKEDFGLQLIDVYAGFFLTEMDRIANDKNKSGLTRLREIIVFTKDLFESEKFVGGCPLGNLAIELGDINERFADHVAKGLTDMQQRMERCLQDAINSGELAAEFNAQETAYFILNAWEGALVRMKVERSTKSLDVLQRMIFDRILN